MSGYSSFVLFSVWRKLYKVKQRTNEKKHGHFGFDQVYTINVHGKGAKGTKPTTNN
jgi:hypothetical protein